MNTDPQRGTAPTTAAPAPAGSGSRLGPRRQLGLLWGGVAAALVLLSPLGELFASGLPACPLKSFTGWPCPSCGATRTALALARFDLLGALAISPLASLAWGLFVGGGLVAGVAALAGRGVPDSPSRIPLGWRLAAVAVVLVNWIYLVWAGT